MLKCFETAVSTPINTQWAGLYEMLKVQHTNSTVYQDGRQKLC